MTFMPFAQIKWPAPIPRLTSTFGRSYALPRHFANGLSKPSPVISGYGMTGSGSQHNPRLRIGAGHSILTIKVGIMKKHISFGGSFSCSRPLDRARSVLGGRALDSDAGHRDATVWIFSTNRRLAVIGTAVGLNARTAEGPHLSLGAKPMRDLQDGQQHGRLDGTGRRNLAELLPDLEFLAFLQQLAPNFPSRGSQRVQLLVVKLRPAAHPWLGDLRQPLRTMPWHSQKTCAEPVSAGIEYLRGETLCKPQLYLQSAVRGRAKAYCNLSATPVKCW